MRKIVLILMLCCFTFVANSECYIDENGNYVCKFNIDKEKKAKNNYQIKEIVLNDKFNFIKIKNGEMLIQKKDSRMLRIVKLTENMKLELKKIIKYAYDNNFFKRKISKGNKDYYVKIKVDNDKNVLYFSDKNNKKLLKNIVEKLKKIAFSNGKAIK